MSLIVKVLLVSFMAEAVYETLKMFFIAGKLSYDRVIALVVSELIVVTAGIDLFNILELPLSVPYLGLALTGLLVSRGSNFVHDLLSGAEKLKGNSFTGEA